MINLPRQGPLLACLWLTVTVGFLVWRSSTVLVWNDTPTITANLYEEPNPLVWGENETLKRIIEQSFSEITQAGYRPFSTIISSIGTSYFSRAELNHFWWFGAIGIIVGLLAACVFIVARRYVQTDAAALCAVLLFLFSAPFISGAWVVFAGIQSIVPLMICVGLIFYWRAVESSPIKKLYLCGLFAVLLVGPLFREFIGILPLLIIFLEAQKKKRPTILMGVAAVFFVHALYPTALIKWSFYPTLPLRPVFAMGYLGVESDIVANDPITFFDQVLSDLQLRGMPLHFLTLFPSMLFLITLIALLLPLMYGTSNLIKIYFTGAAIARTPHRGRLDKDMFLSLLFVSGTILVLYKLQDQYWDYFWFFVVSLWFCLGLVFLALCHNAFLAWWFILSFIPLLKVFTEQVHLAYALLPASIITVAAVEHLWKSVQSRGILYKAARLMLYSALVIAAADHLLNPYNSYRVVRSINDGIRTMADWFRLHVPQGSIVITNALHAEDIRLFSGGHIKVLWTVRTGIPRQKDAVAEPTTLEKLLKGNHTKRDIYFLDVDFNYAIDKADYHTHKYVRNRSVAMKEIGLVHTTRVRYFFIDPLKKWVPRPYVSFLGAPDLENDFYRGPAQNGAPFMREVYAEYRVYKVTGTEVDPWNSVGSVRMAKEGYKGFNILELNGRYFGIPQGEGPFSLQKVRSGEYSRSFVSDEYRAVIDQIDKALKNGNSATGK